MHRNVQRGLLVGLSALLVVVAGYQFAAPSSGVNLGLRTLQLSNADAGVSSIYRMSFTYATSGTLGSIAISFCSNDPLPQHVCIAPAGMDTTSVALTSQSGAAGFMVSSGSPANKILLKRIPTPITPVAATYELSGIINPSSPGTYYARVQTFASNDGTGPSSDYGGMAISINNALAVTATVPPYLIFCTAVTIGSLNCAQAVGDYIDFGELSPSRASKGTSQFLVASNAGNGFNVSVHGTTLTSGSNEITAIVPKDVSRPGTPQFGFNLRANSTPGSGKEPTGPGVGSPDVLYNQPNFYRFVSDDTLVSVSKPDDVRLYTSAYITNIPTVQAAGVYVSTLTYICLANF